MFIYLKTKGIFSEHLYMYILLKYNRVFMKKIFNEGKM